MSIRTKIAWTAFGCVLLSGAVTAAEPIKPDPKHDRDAPNKPAHVRPESPNASQPTDPVTATPAAGAEPVNAAISVQAGAANAFQKIDSTVAPAGDPLQFVLINSTTSTFPAGTVVWLSPSPINGDYDIVMSGPDGGAMHADGTSASMDRYIKIGVFPPGTLWRPTYNPSPRWQGCYAATGMAILMPVVPLVE